MQKKDNELLSSLILGSYTLHSMTDSSTAPATKADVTLLKAEVALVRKDLKAFAKQDDLQNLRKDITQQFFEFERRFLDYFMMMEERLRRDVIGANKDQLQSHEARINRLERKTGIA